MLIALGEFLLPNLIDWLAPCRESAIGTGKRFLLFLFSSWPLNNIIYKVMLCNVQARELQCIAMHLLHYYWILDGPFISDGAPVENQKTKIPKLTSPKHVRIM